MGDPKDVITLITALISMVASAGALLLAAFIFYRIREDISFMNITRNRLDAIEKFNNESTYVSDQLTNVLYDLYTLISSLKAYIELSEAKLPVSDKLFDDVETQIAFTEKHFAELGLFSQDPERRKTVQQSLANMFGDIETLELMQKIANRKIGIFDENIIRAIRMLRNRLKQDRVYLDSSVWAGRPSGGAF
ncbi:MAG: hypothetical protein ACOY6K_21260 [Pseudomonadota bacterium]